MWVVSILDDDFGHGSFAISHRFNTFVEAENFYNEYEDNPVYGTYAKNPCIDHTILEVLASITGQALIPDCCPLFYKGVYYPI